MPHPLGSAVRADKVLTNFAVGYKPQEFIASEVFPIIRVPKPSGKYFVFGKELYDVVAQARANMGPYKRVQHNYAQSSYACLEYGLEEPVDMGVQAEAEGVDPRQDAAALVMELMYLGLENRVATEILTTSQPTTVAALSSGDRWDDPSSDPVQQIETYRNTIIGLTGVRPNRLMIGYQVLAGLKTNDAIKDRIKYGGGPSNPAVVTLQDLAALFEVEKVVVGRAVKNTAKQGQATSLSSIWGKNALLYYAPSSPSMQSPALGMTFLSTHEGGSPLIVESYEEPQTNSEVIRARWHSDEVRTGADFGALLQTVVS